ncbi:guanylate kinase [Dehalobacter sp. DCM]|uniref:guanylate kinase n=1 Tax=Dehalobacter sp. DCM TaxID=2907827 RepID=UPI00308141CE|nr:guanylate kinase [Dehalobacter sp. DCM]
MGKIFCIMGKSSSGKDTLFRLIKEDKDLNLIAIVPYTTRPIRNNETDGVEYHFISAPVMQKFADQGKIIEKREYATVKGIWCYCTIDDGQIDLSRGNYVLIGTLEAYHDLKSYYGRDNVIPITIAVDDGHRLERALARERQQLVPNYDELCRRFLADNADFSSEKLETYGIRKIYMNDNLNQCFARIKKEIMAMITNQVKP